MKLYDNDLISLLVSIQKKSIIFILHSDLNFLKDVFKDGKMLMVTYDFPGALEKEKKKSVVKTT